jgi:hypothetical protein
MLEEALSGPEDQLIGSDIVNGRKWMQKVTSKLFEAQSAMSRHRFKLVKRMGDSHFERPRNMLESTKKWIMSEYVCPDSNDRTKVHKRARMDATVKVPRKGKETGGLS